MKAQLSIEIGFDNIRACVALGKNTQPVPLGSGASPYTFAPIAVKTDSGYIFGEVAKLCAVSAADTTVFLYDYLSQNIVPREALVSLLDYVKTRTEEIYNVEVDSIALITPPYFKDLVQARFLDSCINAVANKIEVRNSMVAFSRSNLNINVGERVLFIDFRDNPSHMSLLSRTDRSYESIGSLVVDDFSSSDCQIFVEDAILSLFDPDLFAAGEIVAAWIQGEIASKVSQDAVAQLLAGKDVAYEAPFTVDTVAITQADFQRWLLPKIDNLCVRLLGFVTESGLTLSNISRIVLLGDFFQSRLVRARIERYIAGYNQQIKCSYFSAPMDQWKMCKSVLINNLNSRCALEL